MACQAPEWVDILYLVGTGRFWLLTRDVAEDLDEAAHELYQWASLEDPARRNATLSEKAGIMECFLPASPGSFLSDEERDRYFELERELAKARVWHNGLDATIETSPLPAGREADDRQRRLRYQRQQQANEIRRLEDELNALRNAGRRAARGAGYVVDGDAYYGPWENEIQQALETYRRTRREAMRRHELVPGVDHEADDDREQRFTLLEVLAEYQTFLESCETQTPNAASAQCHLAEMLRMAELRSGTLYAAYLESILQLAALGIATPEYALANPSASGTALRDGVGDFDDYNDLLREQADLLAAVETKLEEWQTGTAGHTALPLFLFADERERYQELSEQLDALHESARQAVETMRPRRVLFWQADLADERNAFGYEKRSLDMLVRNDWPLREFTSAGGERELCHISLHLLMDYMSIGVRDRIAPLLDADGVLPATLWEAPETALSHWLDLKGCEPIDWRGEWHDDDLGLFQPEAFYAYLDEAGYEIASLASADARSRWGETLQRLLFTGPARDTLRLFDASAQAQALRLIGLTQGELSSLITLDFPEPLRLADTTTAEGERETRQGGVEASSSKGPLRREWKLKGDYHLARGELTLNVLDLPEEDEALHAKLPLKDGGELDLGRYALLLETVAKGFAGASLAMSGALRLSFDGEPNITADEPVHRLGIGGQLNAFLGVRGGIEHRCELRWEPPEDIAMRAPMHQAVDAFTRRNRLDELQEWRSLGMVAWHREHGVAWGGNADFHLGLRDGKFVLRAKAALFCGRGVGGGMTMELDNRHLDLWLTMLHRDLVASGFERVDWLDDEAFNELSDLGYVLMMPLLNAGLVMAKGRAWLRQLRDELAQTDRAGQIAYVLTSRDGQEERQLRAWVQQLTPEALGALLWLLSSPPRAFEISSADSALGGLGMQTSFSEPQARDLQQMAIANCVGWIHEGVLGGVYGSVRPASGPNPGSRLFEKALLRLDRHGKRTHAVRGLGYCRNRYLLDRFMESPGLPGGQSRATREKYLAAANSLGRHADAHCEYLPDGQGGMRVIYEEPR
ncbi:hypothetical protein [Halomonas heilongjiangensis]|uniref:Uncharacterized protein n=1 Tax=Halomonas heilongjiangensis TaxID=1387883 RepID=A0A2N7TM84_9GAMM|nr:hypothetical protein [Halomonas heilongjiangensis]PMR69238.1 hypothetical protein C1H66_11700 [Halomonas heilongjiangensis]PXX87430.1 hypothetical protein CR158_18860 [Halomonas heilongjiangensis]